MASALAYVEETLINAEIVKLLPKFLAPVVGGILSRCLNSHKTFFQSLIPATQQRIEEQDRRNLGYPGSKHVSAPKLWIHSILEATTNPRYFLTRPTAFSGSLRLHPSRVHGQPSASSTS